MRKTLATMISLFLMVSLFVLVGTDVASAASKGKALKIGVTMQTTVENPWNRALLLAADRVKARGYKFTLNYVEGCTRNNDGRKLRSFAEQGYDIIIDHASIGFDDLLLMHKKFPKVAFMVNEFADAVAPNIGRYCVDINEATYL